MTFNFPCGINEVFLNLNLKKSFQSSQTYISIDPRYQTDVVKFSLLLKLVQKDFCLQGLYGGWNPWILIRRLSFKKSFVLLLFLREKIGYRKKSDFFFIYFFFYIGL